MDHLARVHPTLPIWACGYSFGSWIALTDGAIDDRVCCLVGVAPPVGEYDYSAVGTCRKPVFLVHGERDQLTPLGAVRRFYAGLDEPKELVVIDGADHGFDGTASQVGDALEELLSDFTC